MEEQTEEPQPPLGWPPRNLDDDEVDDVDEEEDDERSVTPLEESLMELDLDMTFMEPLQKMKRIFNLLSCKYGDSIE